MQKLLIPIFFIAVLLPNAFSQEVAFKEDNWFWTSFKCDDCAVCGGDMLNFAKEGNKTIETKTISAFCEGKDIGVWKINYINICIGTVYEKEYYEVPSTDKQFRTESDARNHIYTLARKLCSEGNIQEGYITYESKKKAWDEREKRRNSLMEDYRKGKIIPDTNSWNNQIRPSTLSGEEITSHDWELAESGAFGLTMQTRRIKFNPDGTFHSEVLETLTAPKVENGTWEMLTDNTVLLTHDPRIGDLLERVSVYKEKLSFWEDIGTWGVSSSKPSSPNYLAKRISAAGIKNNWSLATGEWFMKVQGYPKNRLFEITAALTVKDSIVIGNLLSAKSGDQLQCADAKINGTTKNGWFNLTITYFDETCVGQEYVLQGYIVDERKFFGQFYLTKNSTYSNNQRGSGGKVAGRVSMNKAKVTGIIKGVDFENVKKEIEKPLNAKILNGTFETLDGWSYANGKVEIEGNSVSMIPDKNGTPVILKSEPFQVSYDKRKLRFGIYSKNVISGSIKVFIIDAESQEKKEVYSEEIQNTLNKAKDFLGAIEKGKIPSNEKPKRSSHGVVTKSHEVEISEYQRKTIQLEFHYKTTGIKKEKIYIDNIKMNKF